MINFSIKSRMWLVSGISIAMLLALWCVTWFMASSMKFNQGLITNDLEKSQLLQDAASLLQQLNMPGNDVLASWDHRTERTNLESYRDDFERHEQSLESRFADDEELKTGYDAIRADIRLMVQRATETIDEVAHKETASAGGDLAGAQEAATRAAGRMAEMDQAFSTASQKLRALEVTQRARIAALLEQSTASNRTAVTLAFGVLVVALFINLLMAVLLIRSITLPVNDALSIAERIADGDLREVMLVQRQDETGKLLQAMGHMSGNLRALLGDLRSGVAQLSSSSLQIGSTAAEYAASSAQQATSVAEICATVEEIKQTSQAAAAAARDVAEDSDDAASQGREGRARLDKAVATMEAIDNRVRGIASQILQLSEQTSQIGVIVESVNDLAEQSNLLAVNASIEAAKAGEQGRGFSVVASEMRSLAEQSKRATQQIRAILLDIQKATQSAVMATEEGTKRADDGRQTIEGLRELIDTLAGTLEDASGKGRQIAGAASQQASGIAQIAIAIEGVSRGGQDNAKGVRQLDQAVRDLGALASELRRTSEKFRMA